jgi:hypothetical protein
VFAARFMGSAAGACSVCDNCKWPKGVNYRLYMGVRVRAAGGGVYGSGLSVSVSRAALYPAMISNRMKRMLTMTSGAVCQQGIT